MEEIDKGRLRDAKNYYKYYIRHDQNRLKKNGRATSGYALWWRDLKAKASGLVVVVGVLIKVSENGWLSEVLKKDFLSIRA